jgi:hypothetical protein
MVGQGEELLEKTTEVYIAGAAWLAKEADKGKRHNSLQDDFGSSNDEPSDGSPSRSVIPRSEKEGTKPPYVCPGCSNHTHGNNMINRCNVVNKQVIFLT